MANNNELNKPLQKKKKTTKNQKNCTLKHNLKTELKNHMYHRMWIRRRHEVHAAGQRRLVFQYAPSSVFTGRDDRGTCILMPGYFNVKSYNVYNLFSCSCIG